MQHSRAIPSGQATPTRSSLISTHARSHLMKPSPAGDSGECVGLEAILTGSARGTTHRLDISQSPFIDSSEPVICFECTLGGGSLYRQALLVLPLECGYRLVRGYQRQLESVERADTPARGRVHRGSHTHAVYRFPNSLLRGTTPPLQALCDGYSPQDACLG